MQNIKFSLISKFCAVLSVIPDKSASFNISLQIWKDLDIFYLLRKHEKIPSSLLRLSKINKIWGSRLVLKIDIPLYCMTFSDLNLTLSFKLSVGVPYLSIRPLWYFSHEFMWSCIGPDVGATCICPYYYIWSGPIHDHINLCC